MSDQPVPGPWQLRARSDTTPAEVTWQAPCDHCGTDATWRKGKDAARPTCTCTCQPEESVA